MTHTAKQAIALGEQVIDALQLKPKKNGRVDMKFGDKTPEGLGRTIIRMVKETAGDKDAQGAASNTAARQFVELVARLDTTADFEMRDECMENDDAVDTVNSLITRARALQEPHPVDLLEQGLEALAAEYGLEVDRESLQAAREYMDQQVDYHKQLTVEEYERHIRTTQPANRYQFCWIAYKGKVHQVRYAYSFASYGVPAYSPLLGAFYFSDSDGVYMSECITAVWPIEKPTYVEPGKEQT